MKKEEKKGTVLLQGDRCASAIFRLFGAMALIWGAGPVNAQESAPPLYVGRLDSFRGQSLDQKVQLLTDREEIRDLIATYAHRAAHRQSMADLFTDDGAFINHPDAKLPPMEVRGRSALDKYFNDLGLQPQRPLPLIHNFLISVRGDEARALSSIEVRIISPGGIVDASGYYRDRLRRESGRWKFVERDCTFFTMIAEATEMKSGRR